MPKLQQFEPKGSIGGVPDFVVQTGQSGEALAEAATSLGSRLKGMADRAAAREGEEAGRNAGRAAGEKYVGGPAGEEATPLQLRNAGTIRGEAFDAAAINAYGWRMSAGLGRDLGEAFEANKDSPGGYEAAIGQIRQKYVAGDPLLQGGEMGELFDRLFVEKTTVARLSVQANHERRLAAERRAATVDGIGASYDELERAAYNAGTNPDAIAALSTQADRVLRQIDQALAAGTLSAEEAQGAKDKLRARMFDAQTQGTFDQLPTPGAKQDFALSIMDDYASGKGPFGELTLDEAKTLSAELYRRAAADLALQTTQEKAEAGRLEALIADDVASMTANGTGIDQSVEGFTPERVAALLGEETAATWKAQRDFARQVYSATAGMDAMTPRELQARLTGLQASPGAAGYTELSAVHAAATERAQAILEAREKDPLLQANFAGLVQVHPIDTTTPEALEASLVQRAEAARIVSSQFGTPMTVFRPDERASIVNALIEHPDQLPQFAVTARKALGPLADKAMAELAEEGPVIAHAAGIGLATGNNAVAADLAQVIAGRRDGAYKAKMPGEGQVAGAINVQLGGAFLGNDQARGAVAGVAALLFEKDANQLGFDPAEYNKPGTAAAEALTRAIDRAMGAQQINGQKWGGLGLVNGQSVALPSFMPAEEAEGLLGQLTDRVLEALPPVESGNGVPLTAADMRRGRLVATGDGTYRLALGDPLGYDPQYVATPDGDYWELDFETLQRLVREGETGMSAGSTMDARRPGAAFGGR